MVIFIFIMVAFGFFLIGIILMISLVVKVKANKKFPIERNACLIMTLFVLGAACFLFLGLESGKKIFKDSLAREVMLEQVPVKGEISFPAGMEIIFREGELSDIVLIEGSTKSKK